MSGYRVFACTLVTGVLILLLMQFSPAHAQEPNSENDANCVACHEHQYYLYDSGNWFCLCDAPMHCVYCHSGRTDTLDKELAHEGLVLYPTRDQAVRCQACHTEDYLSRVVTFASVAGISTTPQPIITATPGTQAAALVERLPASPLLRLGQLEPWRMAGLAIVLVVIIVLVFLGYRCWKAECLASPRP